MNKISLEINFKCESFDSALEVWSYLEPWFRTIESNKIENDFTGTILKSSGIQSSIKRTSSNGFSYSVDEGSIFYNNSGSANGQIGHVTIKDILKLNSNHEACLVCFLKDDRFTSAWLFDSTYSVLQNTTDIGYFKRKGIDYSHLPIKNNGLPPPLTKDIIDISANPGRRVFNHEYIEAVGSTMWLGERFWQVTGTSKNKVLSSDQFDVTEKNGVVKVVAQDAPFTDWKGEQGERQNQLRKLLFGF